MVSSHGIDEYFREYLDYTEKYAHPNNIARTLETLARCNGVEVRVRNYSRCKGRLLEETAAWMGLADDALQAAVQLSVSTVL